jgi:hypothetical protein
VTNAGTDVIAEQSRLNREAIESLTTEANVLAEEAAAASGTEERSVEAVAHYTWYLFLATVALATATVVLSLATGLLVFLGFRQSRDARDSIETARLSALAAQKSADIAEHTLTSLERPWMVFTGILSSTSGPPAEDGPPEWIMTLGFENIGKTPARIDRCEVVLCDAHSIPSEPYYSQAQLVAAHGIVAPDKSFETTCAVPGISVRDGAIAIYGRFFYTDLNNTPHQTGFCLQAFVSPLRFTRWLSDLEYHT